MNCHNSTQRTLYTFVHSFSNIGPGSIACLFLYKQFQSSRSFSSAHQRRSQTPSDALPSADDDQFQKPQHRERPAWQIQKEALKEKFGGQTWSPRKKLSPDAMEGVRQLHASQPDKFTTPVLAEHFKVSPEAVRRILKSNWRPSETEDEERRQRWEKRGERIWTNLVEMGVKPPKQWREMGVGKAENGEKPRWKSGNRRLVDINDSVSPEIRNSELRKSWDIIPTANEKRNSDPPKWVPFSKRL